MGDFLLGRANLTNVSGPFGTRTEQKHAHGLRRKDEAARFEHRTHLDTLFVDADERKDLTSHAAIPIPRKLNTVERIELLEKKLV